MLTTEVQLCVVASAAFTNLLAACKVTVLQRCGVWQVAGPGTGLRSVIPVPSVQHDAPLRVRVRKVLAGIVRTSPFREVPSRIRPREEHRS